MERALGGKRIDTSTDELVVFGNLGRGLCLVCGIHDGWYIKKFVPEMKIRLLLLCMKIFHVGV